VNQTVPGASALLLCLASCGPSGERRAERVPVEPLPLAADTILTPYGQVPEAAWLGGRRWIVVAGEWDAAVIADFDRRSTIPLGGATNTEISKPFGVFTVGDTIYLADWGKSRTSMWTAAGKLLGALPGPAGTRGILPRGRDAAGQLYFEVPPIAGPDGRGNKDSIVVVRADPGLTRFDTVAKLAPAELAEVTRSAGRRFERLVFSGSDFWGVRPDGTVWIARLNGNRVNRVAGGKERRGEALPDPVLEVTREDRERFLQSFPEDVRPAVEDLPFSSIKPPFERAFAGPDGAVWLRKSRAAVDSTMRYHVVDTAGVLARVLQTVGNGVIVAVGTEAVLLAEQYREGVRLMEVRIPAVPPKPQ
jgi:hypothetical protein